MSKTGGFMIVAFIATVTLVCFLVFEANAQVSVNEKVTHTEFTDTSCTGRTCQLNIHSSPVNFYDDELRAWKKAEKVEYHNGTWFVYREIDPKTNMTVENYNPNRPEAWVCINVKDDAVMRDIPLTVSRTSASSTNYFKLYEDEKVCLWLNMKDADFIKFGEESTEIYLYPGNVSVDDYYDEDGATDGTQSTLLCDLLDGGGEMPIWLYDLYGILPPTADVLNAQHGFYVYYGSDDPVEIWSGTNETLANGVIDKYTSVQALIDAGFLSYYHGTWTGTDATYYIQFVNVTDALNQMLDDGRLNLTIMYNKTVDTADFIQIFSTESAGNNGDHTYLNITYAEGSADTTPPDIDITTPAANDTTTQNESYVYIVATADEALGSCTLDNTTNNISMTTDGVTCYYNMTGQSNLTVLDFRVFGSDASGNHNVTSWMRVTINLTAEYPGDEDAPDLNFITPSTNDTTTQNESYAFVNVSSDEALSACILENGTVNLSATVNGDYCYYNITGQTNLTVLDFRMYGNDTSGNMNVTESRRVTINLTDYFPPACEENVTNTTHVNHANISCNTTDYFTLNWSWTEWDQNECGTFNNISWYNYTYEACDYCQYNITNTSFGDWYNITECNATNQTLQQRDKTEFDTNYTTCCSITGIEGDCYANVTYSEYQIINCSYTPPEIPSVAPIFPIKLLFSYWGYSAMSYGRSTGITDNSTYWLCTAADCSTTCQIEMKGGLITDCF